MLETLVEAPKEGHGGLADVVEAFLDSKDEQSILERLLAEVPLSHSELDAFSSLLLGYPVLRTFKELEGGLSQTYEAHRIKDKRHVVKARFMKLKRKLRNASLEGTYRITNVCNLGYMLDVNTEYGQERLAKLKETPLHEAKYWELASQIAFLSGIRMPPFSAMLFTALAKFPGHFFTRRSIPITAWRVRDSSEHSVYNAVKKLKTALNSREINGFFYKVKNNRSGSYSLIIVPVNQDQVKDELANLERAGVFLTPTEAVIYKNMVLALPCIVLMDDLCPAVWGSSAPTRSHNYISLYISRIKGKFADSPLHASHSIRLVDRHVAGKVGYILEIKTPPYTEKSESLKRTPLHLLKDPLLLKSVLELNGISIRHKALGVLMALFPFDGFGVATYDQLAKLVWGDTYKRVHAVQSSIFELKRALEGREVNGFSYSFNAFPKLGYSIEISRVTSTMT